MAVFDIDGSNTIELPEFLSFVKFLSEARGGGVPGSASTRARRARRGWEGGSGPVM